MEMCDTVNTTLHKLSHVQTSSSLQPIGRTQIVDAQPSNIRSEIIQIHVQKNQALQHFRPSDMYVLLSEHTSVAGRSRE